MSRIFVLGNVSVDFTINLKSTDIKVLSKEFILPRGVKIDIDEFDYFVGGSAHNIGYGLKNAGHQVCLYTQTGQDQNSHIIKSEIKKNKLKANIYHSNDHHTASSVIMLYGGDRTILTCGTAIDYNLWHIDDLEQCDWLVIGPLHGPAENLIDKIIRANVKNNFRIAFIPSNYLLTESTTVLRRILKVTDLYISNFEEARILTHQMQGVEIKRLSAIIMQYGPQVVAITQGKCGASIYSEDIFFDESAYEIDQIVDTTGAGDAFSAGLIATLAYTRAMNEKALFSGLKIGLLNAKENIKYFGATVGTLNSKEFKRELNKYQVNISN